MKFLLSIFSLFVCICQLSASNPDYQVEVIAENETSIQCKIKLNNYKLKPVATKDGLMYLPIIKDGTEALIKGHPDLPLVIRSIVIDEHRIGKAKVISSVFEDLDETPIAPSKGNLYRNINPINIDYAFDQNTYQQEDFYPASLIHMKDPYIFRDYKGQAFSVSPFQYNPSTKTLRVYSEIIIEIQKVAIDIDQVDYRKNSSGILPSFHHLYQERFINFNSNPSRYEYIEESGSMLIITNEKYNEPLADFITWKNQKGISIEVLNTEDIGNDVNTIQQVINDRFVENSISYVLLVGDETQVTSRLVSNGGGDGYCDHCYGYISGDDHYPELFVGRFLIHNEDELKNVVSKTLEYEQNPFTTGEDWFSTAIGVGSDEGPGDDGEYDFEHMNNIKSDLINFTYNDVYEFYGGNQSAISPTPNNQKTIDKNGHPSAQSIVDVLESQGASLYNYVGHGDHGILVTGNMTNAILSDLTNEGAYPFCIAVACCVGDFDESSGNGDCFGEYWLKGMDELTGRPAGGIGGCFSSVLQSWSPPMEGQDEMNKLITRSGAHSINHSLGSIAVHGGSSMIDQYGGAGEEMMDTWNIFGDPSVTLRTAMPSQLIVSHASSVFIGTPSIQIFSNTENALISLFYRGENIGTGYIDNGQTTIEIQGNGLLYPEELIVTGTALNTIPYQGPIDVIPASGPYVLLNDYSIDDGNGNQNGQVDFNENIKLDINFTNVGLEMAPNVTAIITTDDPNITITKDVQAWGDIAVNQESLQLGAYEFEVKEFIPNGHLVKFNVEITSDTNIWNGFLNLKMYSPTLNIGAFEVNDAITGNGNGLIDAGESIEVYIENFNSGGSSQTSLTGQLMCTHPNITISDDIEHISLLDQSQAIVLTKYTIDISQDIPNDTKFELQYMLNGGLYSASKTELLRANLLIENFENEAINSNLWTNDTIAPWFQTDTNPFNGGYCFQSGDINDKEETTLEMNLDILKDGMIEFAIRLDCEADWDFLQFYVDGIKQNEWSGAANWKKVSFPIEIGQHTLSWIYDKDDIISAGSDAVWIDDVILPEYALITSSSIAEILPIHSINMAPNPAMDFTEIKINLLYPQPLKIDVFNGMGQLVLPVTNQQMMSGDQQFKIDTNSFDPGIYLINITSDQQSSVFQLVVH